MNIMECGSLGFQEVLNDDWVSKDILGDPFTLPCMGSLYCPQHPNDLIAALQPTAYSEPMQKSYPSRFVYTAGSRIGILSEKAFHIIDKPLDCDM